MKAVIQRVKKASVTVDGKITGEVGKGFLVLLGVVQGDTEEEMKLLAKKVAQLRIFTDENDKMNLSLDKVDGEVLVVSQFTLCADVSHGRRPSFTNSAPADIANDLYEKFVALCRERVAKVETGEFGADMKVSLENDGPFTIVLDSKDFGM